MTWAVYLLRCKDGSLYTGSTTNVARRVKEHQAGCGGAYTRRHRPVALVYTEPQPDRRSAQRREFQIKHWPRVKKLALAG